jgi:hypothetical protein
MEVNAFEEHKDWSDVPKQCGGVNQHKDQEVNHWRMDGSGWRYRPAKCPEVV